MNPVPLPGSTWHPAGVEQQWEHDGTSYHVVSMYLVTADAWTYELTGPPGDRCAVAVEVPDATPHDGPFTPVESAGARVTVVGGPLPWLLLRRFIRFVEASGDLVAGSPEPAVSGDLALTLNSWRFAGRSFEVNSFHDARHDGWCYELYEVDPANTANDYLYVRIPDLNPDGGPFAPADARQVVLAAYGEPVLPWPVLQHFLDAVSASGDIVGEPG
ncbi:hypothetical protein Asp14428_75360 [Actinoplanes sp. NBRC 14428]|nr:hypothetical protein Asp14428_75360 [Actinoplanes sp. NBRC 14428]